jgi:penicillin-binding protein 2
LARRVHLGEKIGLGLRQENSGYFPKQIDASWTDGNTANMCIGQDPVLVTPLQIAVLTSALANGGKVLWPAVGQSDRTAGPDQPGTAHSFPAGPSAVMNWESVNAA